MSNGPVTRASTGSENHQAGSGHPATWNSIAAVATKSGSKMGHALGKFNIKTRTPSVRMAMCKTCHGCWIAVNHKAEYTTGGRLFKYRCGTPEAQGFIAGPAAPDTKEQR